MKYIFDYIEEKYMYPKKPDSVKAIEEEILNELINSTDRNIPEVIELDSYRYNQLKQYADECERCYVRMGGVPASAYGRTIYAINIPWGIVEIREKKEEN